MDDAGAGRAPVRAAAGAARALAGVVQEATWIGLHVAAYPAGLLRERARAVRLPHRLDPLAPIARGLHHVEANAVHVPVILVHGLVDNRSIFSVLRRVLARRGFQYVVCHSYSFRTTDVAQAAADLGVTIERVCAETGQEQVVIVGHSLGGLLARWYVQKQGGDARVRTVVTLGTPHAGSHVARVWPTSLARQILPGSSVIAALRQPAVGCATRFVAVWSDLDQLIAPTVSARMYHPDLLVTSVLVRGVGHMSLLLNGRVLHEVVSALTGTAAAGPVAERAPTAPPDVIDLRDETLAGRKSLVPAAG